MASNISSNASEDFGKLLLRSVLAILMLMHGIAKLTGGVSGITGMVAKAGLPAELGYLVYIGEVAAPLLVLLGIWTRPAALVMAINMVVAILLVHTGDFMSVTKTGGWALELQAFFLVNAIVIALLGAGRFSVGGIHGKWN